MSIDFSTKLHAAITKALEANVKTPEDLVAFVTNVIMNEEGVGGLMDALKQRRRSKRRRKSTTRRSRRKKKN